MATSTGGTAASTRTTRVDGVIPAAAHVLGERRQVQVRLHAGAGDERPLALHPAQHALATSDSMARRTVERETAYASMSSRSEGIAESGARSVAAILASTARSCTCFGSAPSVRRRGAVVVRPGTVPPRRQWS